MASSSVSFRISRSAEDLATTIHAISQRLVQMEQRLEALELQLTNQERPDPQAISRLENVDRLLGDCRALLEMDDELVPGQAQSKTLMLSRGDASESVEQPSGTVNPPDDGDEALLAA